MDEQVEKSYEPKEYHLYPNLFIANPRCINKKNYLFRSVTDMVFSNDQDDVRNNAMARIQALRAASCVKILGKGVIRVVRRVDDAKENNNLGE